MHFLVIGALIFAVDFWRGEAADPASRTITLDEQQVSRLVADWTTTWRRSPTPAEIDALIGDHIREEVYYREALRLGLDVDDPIVRKRMRTKMETAALASVESSVPSDAALQQMIDRNPSRYAASARISFDQQMAGGAAAMLPERMDGASATEIDAQFGAGFAARLEKLPTGQWVEGVRSGVGQHRVRLRAINSARLPRLADIRQRVENDWRAETRAVREDAAYKTMLSGYTITIKRPE